MSEKFILSTLNYNKQACFFIWMVVTENFVYFQSSTLALATLHQCLKVFNISTVVSRFMMLQFQTACQVRFVSLESQKEMISTYKTSKSVNTSLKMYTKVVRAKEYLVFQPYFDKPCSLKVHKTRTWISCASA